MGMLGPWVLAAFINAAILSTSLLAAPPEKRPQAVTVVNTPNVTVSNPQTSVTIDNDATTPVPVTLADPVTANVCDDAYRYIGNSTATIAPGNGINGMHAPCHADFGVTARMCTTKEVFETPSLPPGTVDEFAWVHPFITSTIVTQFYPYYVDFSGHLLRDPAELTQLPAAPRGPSCDAYFSNAPGDIGAALYRTPIGQVTVFTQPCSRFYRVACCRPSTCP